MFVVCGLLWLFDHMWSEIWTVDVVQLICWSLFTFGHDTQPTCYFYWTDDVGSDAIHLMPSRQSVPRWHAFSVMLHLGLFFRVFWFCMLICVLCLTCHVERGSLRWCKLGSNTQRVSSFFRHVREPSVFPHIMQYWPRLCAGHLFIGSASKVTQSKPLTDVLLC